MNITDEMVREARVHLPASALDPQIRRALTAALATVPVDGETVTTVEAVMSFDVIPRGAVVRSAAGTIACRYDERHGTVFGDERGFLWHELALPLTILWTPTPEGSGS